MSTNEDAAVSGNAADASASEEPEGPRQSLPRRGQRRGARSAIGQRALQDIAIVRGRAERAAESLRIRVKALVVGALVQSSSVLGTGLDSWKPLGVFDWQVVRGSEDMGEDEVSRSRALQQVKRKKHVLSALRSGAASAVLTVAQAFSYVAANAKVPVVFASQTAKKTRTRALPSRSEARARPSRVGSLSSVKAQEAPAVVPAKSRSQGPASVGGASLRLPGLRRKNPRPQERSPTLAKKHRAVKPVPKRPRGPLPGKVSRVVDALKMPAEPYGKPADTAALSSKSPSAAQSPVVRSSPSPREPGFPGILNQRSWLGAGAGAVALGLGAAVSAGALSAALTASGALAVASAIVSSPRKSPNGTKALPLPPGFRRSSVVKRIDESILNAASGKVLQAVPVAENESSVQQPVVEVLSAAKLVSRKSSSQADLDTLDTLESGATTTSLYPLETAESDLLSWNYSVKDASTFGAHGDDGDVSPQADIAVVFGGRNREDDAMEGALEVSVGEELAPDGEPVIEADAFQVNPTIPAIFAVPVVGALLNALDELAFAFEQVVARVARRASAAGLPLIGRLAPGAGNSQSWELHRSFREQDL